MWLPEVVAVEKLRMYVRLQTGRKGGTSLLSCHGLDLLVSHCGSGAVVSRESHGVICSKSRTSRFLWQMPSHAPYYFALW